jgi:hypothetical protein
MRLASTLALLGLVLLTVLAPSSADAQRRRRTPDPEPPPTSATGTLTVTVVQEGAEVYIDEALMGTSPIAPQTLSPGAHTLRVRMPGHSEYSDVITVERGATVDVPVELFALAEALSVTTDPPGGHVFVDGNFAGETPVEIDLADGHHSVRITLHGYEEVVRELDAESGRREQLEVTMTPLSADALRGAEWYEEPVTWIGIGAGVAAVVVIVVVVAVFATQTTPSQIDAFCSGPSSCVRVDAPFLVSF